MSHSGAQEVAVGNFVERAIRPVMAGHKGSSRVVSQVNCAFPFKLMQSSVEVGSRLHKREAQRAPPPSAVQ